MQTLKHKDASFRCDLFAAIGGIVLFLFFFITAANSIGLPDESFYYTVPQRILQGDRFLTEEWNYTQLAFIFNIIPFRLYTALTGGTEGIILCMRYMFLAADLCFYAYMCRKLRRFGFPGVLCAFFFCAVIPQTIPALCYHSVSMFAAMHFCLLATPEEDAPLPGYKLFAAGVVLACGVLAEPFLLFAFGVYFVFVLLYGIFEKKKPVLSSFGYLLCKRTFLFVLSGTVAAFAAFMAYYAFSGGLRMLPEVLPHLLTDRDFNSSNIVDPGKTIDAIRFYGTVPAILLFGSLAGATVYRIRNNSNETVLRWLFAAATLSAAACFIWAAIRTLRSPQNYLIAFLQFHSFPALPWALSIYLLYGKDDERCGAALPIGLLYSFCVDVASANVLGTGGKIAQITGVICSYKLARRLFAADAINAKGKKKSGAAKRISRNPLKAILCTGAAALTVWTVAFPLVQGLYPPQEKVFLHADNSALSEKLTAGPCKGLHTAPQIRQLYEATLEDLSAIKPLSTDGGIAVIQTVPWAYLYLDGEISAYSAWFTARDIDRLLDYWRMFPEKRPAYIYIPSYDAFNYRIATKTEIPEALSAVVTGTILNQRAGILIEVREFRFSE